MRAPTAGVLLLGLATTVIASGCGDDTGTGTGDDPPPPSTTEEIIAAVRGAVSQLDSVLSSCAACEVLDGPANQDRFAWLLTEVLGRLATTGTVDTFFGTWDDTSTAPDDGEGVVRVSMTPGDAVRMLLRRPLARGEADGDLWLRNTELAVDTTGGQLSGAGRSHSKRPGPSASRVTGSRAGRRSRSFSTPRRAATSARSSTV